MSISSIPPLIDALPMEPLALKALLAIEGFCLFTMVVVLFVLATQLCYGCMRSFTIVSMVVCCGIATCGILSFVTMEWQPGLIGTGVVFILHLMGADPLGRKAAGEC